MVDGDGEPVLGQRELRGSAGPRRADRLFLEIVAEREIAEHLEEGEVPGGVADIVEIVVLAAGSARSFWEEAAGGVGTRFRGR
jgi:hypothetical protein